MKVMYLLSNDDMYGAPKSTLRMIKLLRDNFDVEPIVISPEYNKNIEFCKENDIDFYIIRYFNTSGSLQGKKLKNFLKKCIAITFDRFFVKKMCKRMDLREIDVIHSSIASITAGYMLSEKTRIPHIWHLREVPTTWYFLRKNQIKMINSSDSSFIAISNFVHDFWSRYGIIKEIKTIYNGIDSSKFLPSKTYTNDEKKIKIVMVGNLVEYKQPDVALKAIGLLKEEEKRKVRLDIYGTINKKYKKELLKIIKQYKIEDVVTFKGYTNDVSRVLGNYNIGLMNSVEEAFGRVTVEYMMASLCVLASNSGANPELIIDGETGLLYDQGSCEDLKKNIVYLLNHTYKIEEFGKSAREYANNNFLDFKNAKEVYEYYEEVLNSRL